jgi:hypothetical protein
MSIVGDPQFDEVTTSTDSSGYFTHSFANNIDAAMASPNQPQAGTMAGIIGASVLVTGAKSVKVRCWEANGSGGIRTCQSKQVTVTLLGLSAV